MEVKTGIIYATVDGQTLRICKRLRDTLVKNNHTVQIFSVDDFKLEVSSFEKFIIGSSIRYGKHNAKIVDFVKKNKAALDKRKTAFFSVNLVARKAEKSKPETNPYVIKFLNEVDWRPDVVGVFAGRLDYKKYAFVDRWMIKLIMLMTKGPVNPKAEIEYTDWSKVREFGDKLSEM